MVVVNVATTLLRNNNVQAEYARSMKYHCQRMPRRLVETSMYLETIYNFQRQRNERVNVFNLLTGYIVSVDV